MVFKQGVVYKTEGLCLDQGISSKHLRFLYRACQRFGLRLPVEAGDYHNPMLLNLEEYSVRKAPYSGTPPSPVDDRELQRAFCDCLDGCLYRPRETFPELWAYVLVPRMCFFQLRVRFPYPDDRQRQGFLNRPALTCSQGMTSEGFCSCRAMR